MCSPTVRGDRRAYRRRRHRGEIVVNCAGQWAKAIGAMAGVNVPLYSAEHFYVVTETIAGVHPDLPILRDPDGYTYFKEEVGGLVIGGFEPEAKPWVAPDQIPYPFEFQLLDEDWEHFEILMENALLRIRTSNKPGSRSSTTDRRASLRTTSSSWAKPRMRKLLRRRRLQLGRHRLGGGAGRALAEWIVNGSPTSDLTGVDIRRFAPFNGNVRWLHDRVAEVLGVHYEIPWPNRELTTARPFRRSPVHHLLVAANANFGSRMGWERANFFAPAGQDPVIEYSWGKQNWLPGRRPNSSPPVVRSPCSTRPRSPIPADRTRRRGGAAVAVHRRYGGAGGQVGVHRHAQRARHLRVRRHRYPHRCHRIPDRQQRSHDRTRQGPHPQEPAARRAGRTGGRHLLDGGVRGDGTALTRAAVHPDRRRPVRRGVSDSPPVR